MRRRLFGIIAAVVLALAGTLLLVAYVNSAKEKAVKAESQSKVLVVTSKIRQGAPIVEIKKSIALKEVPTRLLVAGALSVLPPDTSNLVAGVELHANEQLSSDRLVDSQTLARADVPAGLQEITIALSPERAVGSALHAGDTVGVLFSFAPFDSAASGAADPAAPPTTGAVAASPNTTHFTLHRILVTGVQFSKSDSERASAIQGTPSVEQTTESTIAPTVAQAPADQLLVSLAVTAPEAEQLVFASEFGLIWLTSENSSASPDGTRILTLSQAYIPVPR